MLKRILAIGLLAIPAGLSVNKEVSAASGCHSNYGGTSAAGYCMTGGYYIRLGCRHIDGAPTYYVNGPYRTNGAISQANCSSFGITYRASSASMIPVW